MTSQPAEVAARLRRLTATEQFSLTSLPGGASDRRYYRLAGPLATRFGCESLVAMVAPRRMRPMFDSFVRIGRFLVRRAIPVPAVHAVWLDEGLVLLEDFGDLTMTRALGEFSRLKEGLYEAALDLLARLHRCSDDPDDPCPAFALRFDVEKFRYEFDFHVRRWVIGHWCGARPNAAERRTLARAFDWIGATLAAQPAVFTHRDFQTSNLMVRLSSASAIPQLGLIDFQDARQGLRQYDLASLVYDSYTELSASERRRLSAAYCRLSGIAHSEQFVRLLAVAAIQRKLHDAGAFVYTAAHRGKRDYLRYVPETLRLAANLMAGVPECADAGEVLAGFVERRMAR